MIVKIYTEAGEVTLIDPSRQLLSDWSVVVGMSESDLRLFVIQHYQQ